MKGEKISRRKARMRTGICKRCGKPFNFEGIRFRYCPNCVRPKGNHKHSQPEKISSKEDLIAS